MSVFDGLDLGRLFADGGNPRLPFNKVAQRPPDGKIRFGFGIVTENEDPDKIGRVKVGFPQMGEGCVSDWAPVARPFATGDAGVCVMPDIGDRVICAFVQDNARLPVVLGIVYHKKQPPPVDPAPGNEKKVFSTPSGAQILLEDFMGLEKLTISSGDGEMVAELDVLGGVTVSNGDGDIEIETKELIIGGVSDGSIGIEKDLTIDAKGKVTIDAGQNLLIKASKENKLKGKKIEVDGKTGVTAKMKQIAVKDDQVIGVDMHDELMPSPSGLAPLPMIPNPYIGKLADKLSKDVKIKGKEAATKGSKSKAAGPGHIVIPPGVQFKKPPNNEGEVSSGTESSVKINNKEAAVLTSKVKTCSDPQPQETSVVIAVGVPAGVALAQMGYKGEGEADESKQNKGEGGDNKADSQKSDSNASQNKTTNNQNQTETDRCITEGHPIDVAMGKVFTSNEDFKFPGPIPLKWKRIWLSNSEYEGPLGFGWHHSYDLACWEEDNRICFRWNEGRGINIARLDEGEEFFDRSEKLTFLKDAEGYTIKSGDGLLYKFPQTGEKGEVIQLSSIENPVGCSISFKRNEDGLLESIIDSSLRSFFVENDDMGRILSISAQDPNIQGSYYPIISYKYDDNNDLFEVRDALQQPWQYKYEQHLLVQEMNRNRLNFFFEYDGEGRNARCVRTWGDGGIYYREFKYDTNEKKTEVTNSQGCITTYYSNSAGLVTKIIDPLGGITQLFFDDNNDLIKEVDELDNVTVYQYDERGNRARVIQPDKNEVSFVYNKNLLIELKNELGGIWKWEYDEYDRLVKRMDPAGHVTTLKYNGRYISHLIDPVGNEIKVFFNQQGNLVKLVDQYELEASWEYDALGNNILAIDKYKNKWEMTYDHLCRLIQINEPDNNMRSIDYNGEGKISRVSDKLTNIRFEYCGMNKLSVRQEADSRVEFLYDKEENLIGIKNENGQIYSFLLDEKGNVYEERGIDNILRKYTRDKKGNITRLTRANGVTSDYKLDPMDRILDVAYSDGLFEKFKYQAEGRLIEASNQNSTIKFEYDSTGRVVKEWQDNFWIESEYDPNGYRIAMRSSLGAEQKIQRSARQQVEEIVQYTGDKRKKAQWKVQFNRDISGRELERFFPGGLKASYKRDQLGRLLKQTIQSEAGFTHSREYTWDMNSRLKSIIDSLSGVAHYEHDVVGNLVSVVYEDGSSLLRLPDAVGNLFRSKDKNDRIYGKAGELLQANSKDGVTKYEYDEIGNLIKKLQPDGKEWNYSWNSQGMLCKVTRYDGQVIYYKYDVVGRRISKKIGIKATFWIWDGNNILHEWIEEIKLTGNNSTVKSKKTEDGFIKQRKKSTKGHEANGPPDAKDLITWVFEPGTFNCIGRITNEYQFSIINDHVGAPLTMFDEKGQKVWSQDLDIYGAVRNYEGNKYICPFRWPGQYEDVETGLYYNRFRYYDPEIGGYISQDPIGLLGGMRLYSYVPDPNVAIDPKGLSLKALVEEAHMQYPNEFARDRGLVCTAIGEDTQGNKYLAVSGNNVADEQRDWAEKNNITVIESKPGEHAEEALMNSNNDIKHIDASNKVCLDCQQQMEENNVTTDTCFSGKKSKNRR